MFPEGPAIGVQEAWSPTMTDTVRQHGSRRVAMLMIAMAALFTGLGIWQLQRRIEERALVESLSERLRTASVPLPGPSQWHALSAGNDEIPQWSTVPPPPSARIFQVWARGRSFPGGIRAERDAGPRPAGSRDGHCD